MRADAAGHRKNDLKRRHSKKNGQVVNRNNEDKGSHSEESSGEDQQDDDQDGDQSLTVKNGLSRSGIKKSGGADRSNPMNGQNKRGRKKKREYTIVKEDVDEKDSNDASEFPDPDHS